MSEESIVTLIGMILSAGVLAPGIGWLNRRLGDGEAKPAPVTTADADAVHAHQSQQLVLASLNAMGAALASTQGDLEDTRGDLAQEQERTSCLERTVESLRRSQGQDGALIRTLTAWARDVHTRWPALRLTRRGRTHERSHRMVMLTGLADGLRKHGLTVIEIDGWKTRGWAGRGFYGTPKGGLHHHTATTSARRYSTGSPTLNMLISGRSDLPGPLCNLAFGRGGAVALTAYSSATRPEAPCPRRSTHWPTPGSTPRTSRPPSRSPPMASSSLRTRPSPTNPLPAPQTSTTRSPACARRSAGPDPGTNTAPLSLLSGREPFRRVRRHRAGSLDGRDYDELALPLVPPVPKAPQ